MVRTTASTAKSPKRPSAQRARVDALLHEAGQPYAAEAGIRLRDTPSSLWQLLVLANLLGARIRAEIAVAAARALFDAGGRTPKGMAELSWQQRVDAVHGAHYARYDEGTATRLGECADMVRQRYRGDLRRLAEAAEHKPGRVAELLQEFPGIGPTAAQIFCREAQAVWPFLRPVIDKRALDGAKRVDLPDDPARLARLVGADDLAPFAAGLVRVAHDRRLADRVGAAAGRG